MSAAAGSLGAVAAAPVGAEPAQFVLDAWWADEDALCAHY